MEQQKVEEVFKGFDFNRVTVPDASSKIYKEECVLSFHSPRNEGGVFVCLKTFLCFSQIYLPEYCALTKNTLFLNIREVPRTTDQKEDEKKVLQIGDEKKTYEDDTDVLYDQLHSLVFYGEDHKVVPLPCQFLPTKVDQCLTNILARDSERRKMQIVNVKVELKVSKYSHTLKQTNKRKIPKTGWKCSDCEKTDNLWLNLSDGHIGCGRRMYDGSGGNNHAVEHYNKSKFPLVVKLGTITPKGADVFSYAERDMVKDANLAQHLLWFGISMSEMRKTDKTMEELTLDATLKLEFCSVLETGKTLQPVFGPGFTGIANIGSTCYLSALMQVLFATDVFRERYTDYKMARYFSPSNKILDPSEDLDFQMTKMCNGLISGVYSVPSESRKRFVEKKKQEQQQSKEPVKVEVIGQDGVKPTLFKNLVGKNHSEFSKSGQQDPSELLDHLFNLIQRNEELKERDEEHDATHPFRFVLQEKFRCQRSGRVRITETTEHCLSLPILKEMAMNLKEYMAYEKVRKQEDEQDEIAKQARLLKEAERKKMIADGKILQDDEDEVIEVDPPEKKKKKALAVRPKIYMANVLRGFSFVQYINDWYSSAVKTKTTAERTVRIKTFPDYLIVKVLKYYFSDNWAPRKLDVFIEKPQELDLTPYRAAGLEDGEQLLPDAEMPSSSPKKPDLYNKELVQQLVGMGFGFTENACKRGAMATGNKSTEEAINWILNNSGNPNINLPLEEEKDDEESPEPPGDAVAQMTGMGIPKEMAIFSLKKTNNVVMRAVDYYFSHMEQIQMEMMKDASEKKKPNPVKKKVRKKLPLTKGKGKYELYAFISHIGSNVHSGHYVCHIKKGDTWYLYNDEAVSISQETPFDRGYLYFYRRKKE